MKLDLGIKLQKNNTYFWAWNIFSKLILLSSILKEENVFIIICENHSQAQTYQLIWKELSINIDLLDNFQDLTNLIYNKKWFFVATKDLFNIELKKSSQSLHKVFTIKKWQKINPQEIAKTLNELNIEFQEYENLNTFRISGDLLTYKDKYWHLIKISFWDNEIDEIFYDNQKLDNYTFWFNWLLKDLEVNDKINEDLLEKFKNSQIFTILDSIDFYKEYDKIADWLENYIIFSFNSIWKNIQKLSFQELIIKDLDGLQKILKQEKAYKYIVSKNTWIINNYLDLNNIDNIKVISTNSNKLKSFSFNDWFVICDDNLSRIFVKKRIKRSLSESIDLLLEIKKWDFVVHIDHWIWIFNSVVEKDLWWIKREYLLVEYKNEDKLFVPITEVGRLSKYVWNENPKLTSLSSQEWEKKIKKVSEDVNIIAWELLEIYAKRKLQKWFTFLSLKDEENKFLNSFEYVYTDDQFSIIEEIYKDMERETPMDRLLTWDVWFGKTEIAFASIFKALVNWKQSALISPLVVLAYEHYGSAIKRFSHFPFNIKVLTRFEKASEIKEILKNLKEWKIDLIIWTHRLLSEDVEFKDLWLLVIDEEHKFWVKDKEKIKKYKWNIDILSMSATPIPRSLNMALNWLKDVSILTTPPVGKKSIETLVVPFEDEVIFKAGKREFDRWGQIFFIHNKVETITSMQAYLEKLFPWKKVWLVHWQLNWDILEKRIIAFKNREFDILLATTVIENWIDFPNVNTIFINEAKNFWISQIHQLRWRVWRWQEKAYSYLLFKKDTIKEDAAKRLKTIVDYSHLWAGFELAIKDLEIRWWWDILWIRQSWSAQEVGISLFLEMLENKIEELKQNNNLIEDKEIIPRTKTSIDLNIEAYLPNDFFTSELDKLNFYRELESIKEIWDLDMIINDFKEINPNILNASKNLFDLIKLKIYASSYKILSIKKVGVNYQIDFEENSSLEDLKEFLLLDKETKFFVQTPKRLRSSIKNFVSEEKFIQYLLFAFQEKLDIRKIKIKKKV